MKQRTTKSPRADSPSGAVAAQEFLSKFKSLGLSEMKDNQGIKKHLAQAGIPCPFFVVTSDALRSRRLVNQLRENLGLQKSSEGVSVYFGSELSSQASLSSLMGELRSRSLFAPVSLVVIYDLDTVKATLQKEIFAGIFDAKCEPILVATLSSNKKLPKEIPTDSQKRTVLEISELVGEKLFKWMAKEVAQLGCAGIQSDAAVLLAEKMGNDTLSLYNELQKLVLLTGTDELITPGLVLMATSGQPERQTLDLIGKIAQKDIVGAQSLLQSLLNQGNHPLQLSGYLNRCLRNLIVLKNSPEPPKGLHSDYTNPWFNKRLLPLLRFYREEDLKKSLKVLSKLDLDLKSSKLPDTLATGLAIYSLTSRNFSGA